MEARTQHISINNGMFEMELIWGCAEVFGLEIDLAIEF